jgi:hypothetical protein
MRFEGRARFSFSWSRMEADLYALQRNLDFYNKSTITNYYLCVYTSGSNLLNFLLCTKISCDVKCYEIFACKPKPESRNRRIM